MNRILYYTIINFLFFSLFSKKNKYTKNKKLNCKES